MLTTLLLLLATSFAADDPDALLRAGRYDEALAAAAQAARDPSADLDAQELWIDLGHTLGRTPDVVAVLVARLKQNPEDPDTHYLLGRALLDPTASREAYEVALRLNPDHARSWMGLGAQHRAAGRLDKAVSTYQRALSLDPTLSEAWAGVLASLLQQDDHARAREVAAQAREAVPGAVEPYLVGARLDGAAAQALLEAGRDKAGPDARLELALSELFAVEGDGTRALAHATAARQLDPAHSGADLALAFARELVDGDLDASGVRTLRELHGAAAPPARFGALVRSYPRSALVKMARGQAHARAGDGQAALADLEAAVALDPEQPEAAAALGILLASSAPERAVELLGPLANERPHDATLVERYGTALLATGQTAAAQSALRAGTERHPDRASLHLAYAHALGTTDAEAAYRHLSDHVGHVSDIRMVLGLAAAAVEAGRVDHAIEIYEALAEKTGDARFRATAATLKDQRGTR